MSESDSYKHAGLASILAAANLRAGFDRPTKDVIGPRVFYNGHKRFGKIAHACIRLTVSRV